MQIFKDAGLIGCLDDTGITSENYKEALMSCDKRKIVSIRKSLNIPESINSPEEVSKFMRINVDILKQEISEHIDKELERFNRERKKMSECDKCGKHALECRCKGWIYKGNYNLFREMLKDLPPGKIEIIPDDPKNKEIADQMSSVLNSAIYEFCHDCKNELVACVCMGDEE